MSKGSAARNKGHAWEREVAYEHLGPIFGEVRRGRQSREGHDEADVVLPAEVPFWPECEHAKENHIRGKLRQAVAAAMYHHAGRLGQPLKTPVAFLKETHRGKPGTKAEPAIVAMYLPDWLALVKEWWALKTTLSEGAVPTDKQLQARLRSMASELTQLAEDMEDCDEASSAFTTMDT